MSLRDAITRRGRSSTGTLLLMLQSASCCWVLHNIGAVLLGCLSLLELRHRETFAPSAVVFRLPVVCLACRAACARVCRGAAGRKLTGTWPSCSLAGSESSSDWHCPMIAAVVALCRLQ